MRTRRSGAGRVKAARRFSLAATASQLVVVLATAAMATPAPAAAASSGTFSFGSAGDFGYTSAAQTTFSVAGGAGLDFFLVLGDTTYNQTTESTWCSAFRAQVPHVLVQGGNHDIGENVGADLGTLLAACPYDLSSPMTGLYGREWYVDYPASAPLVRFILTGCGNSFDAGNGSTWSCTAGDSHYQFVSDVIDGAHAVGIPWVIVGMHKNCITAATKSCEVGTDFFNLLLDKRVDLILQGHDHLYERSKQLTCATPNLYRPECVADDGADGRYVKGNGSVVMIQGTGGYSHYAYNPADSEGAYFTAAFDDTYGFVKYTVNATTITAQFLRSAGGFSGDSYVIETYLPPPPPPDTTPPSLVLNSPADGAVANVSSIWLAGATEPGARVSVGGAEATVEADGTFGLLVGLTPGPNLLVATAWDASGNRANATLNVTFDDPVPILEAQLAQARVDLAVAQGRVDALDAELNATQAQLTGAQTNLSAARASLQAIQSDVNATRAELDDAQANLTAAEANLFLLEADANETRANLEAARANVTVALRRVSALELDAADARAQQNATDAQLAAAKARADAAAAQAGLALTMGLLAIAVAAVSAILAIRNKGRSKPPGET